MSNKGKFVLCMVAIILATILVPEIVTRYMRVGQESVMLTTDYYVTYFSYVFSAQLGLFYLVFLSYVVFVKKDK
ncbi:hypothetical protein ACTWPF_16125 [Oceanobacillus sp. M65]|uniref:hypothetical protein n=1 Tax=Oceanobacillus sp. M65 TaxID=3457435 RepID=UPI003FCC744E